MFLPHFAYINLATNCSDFMTSETGQKQTSLVLILAFPLSHYTNAAKSKSLFSLNTVTYKMEVTTDNYWKH